MSGHFIQAGPSCLASGDPACLNRIDDHLCSSKRLLRATASIRKNCKMVHAGSVPSGNQQSALAVLSVCVIQDKVAAILPEWR